MPGQNMNLFACDHNADTNSNSTVTVNNQATYRKGEYFWKGLYADNSTGPVWQGITNLAVLRNGSNPGIVTNDIRNALLPRGTESFAYDGDGNLSSDSLWTYSWDAENRLIAMESLADVPQGARTRLEFAYDSQWRRIQKIVKTWNGVDYVPQSTNRFVYDGWNLLGILDPNFSLLTSFQWGLDLSGSMQGAGGVGGLLAVNTVTNGVHFVGYDGNGNVSVFVNAADGQVSGNCEYGPFGEVLRLTGTAQSIPFRFSTKFTDDKTGLVYYGYRYYSPALGRWLSRDPIGERGGVNLYACCANNPVRSIDNLGLWCVNIPGTKQCGSPYFVPTTASDVLHKDIWNCVVYVERQCTYKQFCCMQLVPGRWDSVCCGIKRARSKPVSERRLIANDGAAHGEDLSQANRICAAFWALHTQGPATWP